MHAEQAEQTGPGAVDERDAKGQDLLDALERWHEAGGVWRVCDRGADRVTVALLRCDAGEEVDRLSSSDPVWLAHLAGREDSGG